MTHGADGQWRSDQGFSLLEALIALAILAIAAAGLVGASQAHLDRITALEDRTVASWLAEEQLTELRIAPTAPVTASISRDMAGRSWRVDTSITATDDPELFRADITISDPDANGPQARLSGFIDAGGAR